VTNLSPWLNKLFSLALTRIVFSTLLIALTSFIGVQSATAQTESVIYNFKGGTSDGSVPYSGLLMDSSGNFYGTTTAGGTYGKGIVYKLSPSGFGWIETVLYNFGGLLDGRNPESGLVQDSLGNLYGTTPYGGQFLNNGTFFEITPGVRWTETGLYSFPGGNGGRTPYDLGKLVTDSRGKFYGTAEAGGANGQGLVFKMSISGGIATESVLYNFDNYPGHLDGSSPYAGLIMDALGNLYGTTYLGGSGTCGNECGTVFELTPQDDGTWTEGIIHNFNGGSSDGEEPYGGLVMDRYGNLFGTTSRGGLYNYGTVFELIPGGHGIWTELVIHSFGGPGEGITPWGDLVIDSNRNLYGTTEFGGVNGHGTLYELSPFGGIFWRQSMLYSFKGYPSDGGYPVGALIMDSSGSLYGTASSGGAHQYGTVFKLVP
jgi:uncharacterized repeat protein (TIGR03803 family)